MPLLSDCISSLTVTYVNGTLCTYLADIYEKLILQQNTKTLLQHKLCIAVLAVTILFIIYWIQTTPVNWTRDLSAVGYKHLWKRNMDGVNRREIVNQMRRLRKIGKKLPPPFPNGWFALIESDKLQRGQAINVNCLGENFVVFRSVSGIAYVLDAYCSHLGANLGVGGIVRNECIECPFHQWTFRGSDGECVNIPYSSSGTVPKSARINHWQSYETDGTIFVWYHVDSTITPWRLPIIDEIKSGAWIYHGRNEFTINCHIQEIPENGADTAHLSSVHGPNMLSGSDLRFTRAWWATFGMHTWDANWEPPADGGQSHIATLALKHSIRLFNKVEICSIDVRAKQIGPGYVQLVMNTSFGPMIVLQTVTPIEPLVQKVIHRFYAPRMCALFTKFTLWGESIMFERDIMVWNSKCYMESPCLIKEDSRIKLFRLWFSQFYSVNSIDFSATSSNGIDW